MVTVMTTTNGLTMHYEIFQAKKEKTIVFLHGFTGSTKTWDKVIAMLPTDYRIIAIDLIGHGQTASPKQVSPYSMESQVEMLESFFESRNIEHFTLVGYSMGGRVALAYAAAHSNRIDQLILESASPGLASEVDRMSRRESDEKLARSIEENGVEKFVDQWEKISLFETQLQLSEEVKQQVRKERLLQTPTGLANSLRGMGTGSQKSYWSSLSQFAFPVVLLSGELDSKFCTIAKKMHDDLSASKHIIVPNAGHAIHVENPESFVTIIKKHLL